MPDALASRFSSTAVLYCLLLGFVVPYLGPVAFVRYCPDEARYSFPLVFSKDFLATTDVTMALGVGANTLLIAALALAVVALLGSLPLPEAVLSKVRGAVAGSLPLLVIGALVVVLLGIHSPSPSAAIGPGHVDTPACSHVSGHAVVNNWWGSERFSLLSLKRLGLA